MRYLAFLILLPTLCFARIETNNLFIGEYVLSGTVGAPLSADANGQLVSGITNTEVSATASATTTSTSDVLLTTMTTTPAAGTYLVTYSGTATENTGGATITLSVYVAASQQTASVRTAIPFSSAALAVAQPMVMATNAIVTVNGSQTVQIEWHVSAGTGTINQRTMDIVRLN